MNQTFPCALVEMGPEVGSGLDTMESCGSPAQRGQTQPQNGHGWEGFPEREI